MSVRHSLINSHPDVYIIIILIIWVKPLPFALMSLVDQKLTRKPIPLTVECWNWLLLFFFFQCVLHPSWSGQTAVKNELSARQKSNSSTYYISGWSPSFKAFSLIPKQEAGKMGGVRVEGRQEWAVTRFGRNGSKWCIWLPQCKGVRKSCICDANISEGALVTNDFINKLTHSGKSKQRK